MSMSAKSSTNAFVAWRASHASTRRVHKTATTAPMANASKWLVIRLLPFLRHGNPARLRLRELHRFRLLLALRAQLQVREVGVPAPHAQRDAPIHVSTFRTACSAYSWA